MGDPYLSTACLRQTYRAVSIRGGQCLTRRYYSPIQEFAVVCAAKEMKWRSDTPGLAFSLVPTSSKGLLAELEIIGKNERLDNAGQCEIQWAGMDCSPCRQACQDGPKDTQHGVNPHVHTNLVIRVCSVGLGPPTQPNSCVGY